MAEEIVIDAKNAVLGRLASYAAKQALLGKKIIIANSEKAVIIGNKKDILARYHQKIKRGTGSLKGPYFPRTPEQILKRTIRGMLKYKKARGRESLKRIKCYIGDKEKAQKFAKEEPKQKYISLGELSKLVGG